MPFCILATIIRLHIMNYVALSVVIETYKQKRKRVKKADNPHPPPKKTIPPALQMEIKM